MITQAGLCPDCGEELEPEILSAYKDLYGGFRVDLMKLGDEIKRSILALAANRERHPLLYEGLAVSDRDIVVDAVADWLGHDLEALCAAARHGMKEAQ